MTITTEAPAAAGRDVRRLVLEDLAENELDGTGLPVTTLKAILALAAHRNLVPPRAYQMFVFYLAEIERCRDVAAGEPDYRDVSPDMCAADRDAILADLLDGTGTYHGDRR